MTLLLPHSWKIPSQLIFYSTLILSIFWMLTGAPEGGLKWLQFTVPSLYSEFPFENGKGPGWITNNITDEVTLTLLLVSGLASGFAKERMEDELIATLRLKALTNALLVNAGILLLATWFIHGIGFLYVLYMQLVAILAIFNLSFSWALRAHYTVKDEE